MIFGISRQPGALLASLRSRASAARRSRRLRSAVPPAVPLAAGPGPALATPPMAATPPAGAGKWGLSDFPQETSDCPHFPAEAPVSATASGAAAGFTTGSVTPASAAKPHCATCLRSRSSHGRRTSANRASLAAASRGRSAWCLTWPGPASPAPRPGPARTGSPPPRHRPPPEHRLRGESCWFSVPL